jgi:adenine-specific DNA-methyltransferase
MMYARFELLKELLSEDGTIVIHLDDEELAYSTVVLDEVLGRKNRVNLCTFKQGAAVGHKAINPGLVTVTNYLLIYAKRKMDGWKPNRVFTQRERDSRYASFISNYTEPFENWQLIPLAQAFSSQFEETARQTKQRLGSRYEQELADFVLNNANRVVQPVPPAYAVLDEKHES